MLTYCASRTPAPLTPQISALTCQMTFDLELAVTKVEVGHRRQLAAVFYLEWGGVARSIWNGGELG